MAINITLSKTEKRHYFLYLLGMLFVAVLLVSLIVLWNHRSPFSTENLHAVMILEQKATYEKAQKSLFPEMKETLKKLESLSLEKNEPVKENKVLLGIEKIRNAFKLTDVKDPRKEGFEQIALFYKMYYHDKKKYELTVDNIKIFQSQFEQCLVGYDVVRQNLK